MIPMPDMPKTPYVLARPDIRPGMVAFFSQDTSGFKKLTQFPSWRIKHGQEPSHECTHVGIIDVMPSGRRVLIEATSPRVIVGPLSAKVCEAEGPDGKHIAPYDGAVYVGAFGGFYATTVDTAWDNLLLPYDYLDLLAIRMGIPRRNTKRYICSELVAEALLAGGVKLGPPANGWAWTPADLILSPLLKMPWRLR